MAALVHDPAALADRELVDSVAAAARLAVVNVRLQAEIAARIGDVAASRRRLVEARDDEGRRLVDRLHAGAEQRLAGLRDRMSRLAGERDGEAAETLRWLGETSTPRAELLRSRGAFTLARSPKEASARPSSWSPRPPFRSASRCPPAAFRRRKAAAFFLCSEGLANVAKYAGARADIVVRATPSGLVVCVADDGAGGADPARGSGLRGLADRVEALGGTLRVDSHAGTGTRLEAVLPIAGEGP